MRCAGVSPAQSFPKRVPSYPKRCHLFPSAPKRCQAIPKRFPNLPNPLFNQLHLKHMAISRETSRSLRKTFVAQQNKRTAAVGRNRLHVLRRELVRAETQLHRACPACRGAVRLPAALNMLAHNTLHQRVPPCTARCNTARRCICATSKHQDHAVPKSFSSRSCLRPMSILSRSYVHPICVPFPPCPAKSQENRRHMRIPQTDEKISTPRQVTMRPPNPNEIANQSQKLIPS